MYCMNCGQELPGHANYCGYCGEPQQLGRVAPRRRKGRQSRPATAIAVDSLEWAEEVMTLPSELEKYLDDIYAKVMEIGAIYQGDYDIGTVEEARSLLDKLNDAQRKFHLLMSEVTDRMGRFHATVNELEARAPSRGDASRVGDLRTILTKYEEGHGSALHKELIRIYKVKSQVEEWLAAQPGAP